MYKNKILVAGYEHTFKALINDLQELIRATNIDLLQFHPSFENQKTAKEFPERLQ